MQILSPASPIRQLAAAAFAVAFAAAFAVLVAPSSAVADEAKSWIAELPPPAAYGPRDLKPMIARLPHHKVGTPFGGLSLGLQIERKLISADTWATPGVGATFDPQVTHGLTTLSLSVGGFVAHGHAEVYATLPLLQVDSELGAGRTVSIGYVDLGARVYPWALRGGTLRPFVAIGVARRTLRFSAVADVPSAVRDVRGWVVPLGLGAGFLTKLGVLIDVSAQVVLADSGTLWSGVNAQPLDQAPADAAHTALDVSGMRLTLGVRWVRGLWPQTAETGFPQATAKTMLALKDAGLLSGLTLALGPTFQAISDTGDYYDSRRPYLSEAYGVGVMPEVTVGWHVDPLDSELRLAFRYLKGAAEGYGAKLETSSAVVLLEALKKVDIGWYGVTPWAGLGVGVGWFNATDTHVTGTRSFDHTKVVFSVPFGWDYRLDPSSWWLLRTSFRWVPTVAVDLANGVTFDHGGLEVNVISFVIMPQRLIHSRR